MDLCNYKSKDSGHLIYIFNYLDNERKGFTTRFEVEVLIFPMV